MANVLSKVAFVAVTGLAGVVGYLYTNDNLVKVKVDNAIRSVGEAALEIGNGLKNLKTRIAIDNRDPNVKNQQWVDEQWDALGI